MSPRIYLIASQSTTDSGLLSNEVISLKFFQEEHQVVVRLSGGYLEVRRYVTFNLCDLFFFSQKLPYRRPDTIENADLADVWRYDDGITIN